MTKERPMNYITSKKETCNECGKPARVRQRKNKESEYGNLYCPDCKLQWK